jgi:7-cyano-7-deazaguanine reductase
MKKMKSTYEDLQKDIRKIKLPAIEVWENQYADREYTINIEMPEFTCICPKTGLPDFAVIKIEYSPQKYCLELKSLKMYIIAYRNLGIFNEHLTNRILDDVVKACGPRWAQVTADMNPRGGVKTVVEAKYKKREAPA